MLLGVGNQDSENDAVELASKVRSLRIFPGPGGNMDRSLADIGGEALVVSQFTLYGDTSRGRRPSFTDAAPGEKARPLYEKFCRALQEEGIPTSTGRFGAMMEVELVNEGPVTLLLET